MQKGRELGARRQDLGDRRQEEVTGRLEFKLQIRRRFFMHFSLAKIKPSERCAPERFPDGFRDQEQDYSQGQDRDEDQDEDEAE